jgi:hypothetical protein
MDLAATNREEVFRRAQSRNLLREDGAIMICGTRFRIV